MPNPTTWWYVVQESDQPKYGFSGTALLTSIFGLYMGVTSVDLVSCGVVISRAETLRGGESGPLAYRSMILPEDLLLRSPSPTTSSGLAQAAKFLDGSLGRPFGNGSPKDRGLAMSEGGVETGPKLDWGK